MQPISLFLCICAIIMILIGIGLIAHQIKIQTQKSYYKWMDTNCKYISHQDYYNLDWKNKIPYYKLQKGLKRNGRNQENFSYKCGMHALNMCWLILGYDKAKQWFKNSYPHDSVFGIKVGHHGQKFANHFIYSNFKNCEVYCGKQMPWHILHGDYTSNAVIILVGISESWFGMLHYIVIIAQSDQQDRFIVTDSSQRLYIVEDKQLSWLMHIVTPKVCDYNAYRVG